MNEAIQQVKRAIREPYAWPGGYPVYTVMSDGELLCANCARANFRSIVASTKNHEHDGWQAVGAEVYWEGESQSCGHCGNMLESAYGPVEN